MTTRKEPWKFPRRGRSEWPAQWLLSYSWRKVIAWTPRIRNHALMVTWRNLPSDLHLGVWCGRDDDNEWNLMIGLLLVEITVNSVEFWPVGGQR